jgi:biotin carboxylase
MPVVSDSHGRAKRLLVLGAGPGQLGLLEAARARGLYVIAADRDPAAPGFPLADRRALISAEDEPALERLAAAEEVDGVIAPGIDWPVAIAARIAAKLDLPHPLSVESAQLAVSKLRQRELFAEAGLPHARYAVATRGDEAETVAAELGFPLLVKAPDRQGQRGLALASRREELGPAVELALAESRSGLCLIERLEPGRELSVVGFSLDGSFRALAVSDRERAPAPAFGVTLEHVWPSSLAATELEQAVDIAERAAAVLGIEQGPTYTQIVVDSQGSRLGELAARLGGGHDAELVEAALGIELNRLALAAALGEPISAAELEPEPLAGGACTHFLVAPEGEPLAVHGVAEAAAADGVERVRIYREPGYVFGPLRSRSDRAGAVLALGPDREQAVARARRAADLLRFEIAGPGLSAP